MILGTKACRLSGFLPFVFVTMQSNGFPCGISYILAYSLSSSNPAAATALPHPTPHLLSLSFSSYFFCTNDLVLSRINQFPVCPGQSTWMGKPMAPFSLIPPLLSLDPAAFPFTALVGTDHCLQGLSPVLG